MAEQGDWEPFFKGSRGMRMKPNLLQRVIKSIDYLNNMLNTNSLLGYLNDEEKYEIEYSIEILQEIKEMLL